MLYPFDKFCRDIHTQYTRGGVYRLIEILKAINSLTDCTEKICRDTLPSDLEFDDTTFRLSIIDIDSIDDSQLQDERDYIYSLGKFMFYALTCEDYEPEDFENINDLVNSSRLVNFSHIDSKLREKIIDVLNKCLCVKSARFKSCSELSAALIEIQLKLPLIEAAHIEYKLDEHAALDIIVLNALYSHPIYSRGMKQCINVLIKGFDIYSQKFLDACLQCVQSLKERLSVVVIYDDIRQKRAYLNARPALKNFFNVDGSIKDNNQDSYGTINFCDSLDELDLIYDYVFIESGIEEAVSFSERFASNDLPEIFYVDDSYEISQNDTPFHIHAVRVNQDIFSSEIEDMAFNVHLLWVKNWSISFDEIYGEFISRYNHVSCVSNVVSMKYKLHSLNISLNDINNIDSAVEFCRIISNNEHERERLIYCEHKRWVTEKICAGWENLPVEKCINERSTKNNERKQHVCIVRSQPNQKIITEWQDKVSKWNSQDISNLDELDSMSVRLHRHFMKLAENVNLNDINSHSEALRYILRASPDLSVLFEEWYSCMLDIFNGRYMKQAQSVRNRIYSYKKFRDNFFSGINNLDNLESEHTKIKALDEAERLENTFAPVLEAMRFRDFKNEDTVLIDNIPFIITYRRNITLAVRYNNAPDDKKAFFENIAAALVINPEKIIFTCDDLEACKESFTHKGLEDLIKRKGLRSEIEFVSEEDFDKQALQLLRNGAVQGDDFIFNSESMTFFISHESISRISRTFNYIHRKPFLTVRDIFEQSRSSGGSEKTRSPEFFRDYKFLWELYDKDHYIWKKLCGLLDSYVREHDIEASFEVQALPVRNKKNPDKLVYIIPFECLRTAEFIINELAKYHVIDEQSRLESFTSDSCRVIIPDCRGNRRILDNIFSELDSLRNHESWRSYTVNYIERGQNKTSLKICRENLDVINCKINFTHGEDYNDIITRLHGLLEKLRNRGYIFAPEIDNSDYLSLTFGTRQARDLLTQAGRILEIWVYHKAIECSGFDDVLSSFELDWGEDNKRNEFDCVMTKGFRTLIVECKARTKLELEFYREFYNKSQGKGINTKLILAADTRGSNVDSNNEVIRQALKQFGIHTIYEREKIQDIGSELLKFIN